MIAWLRDILLFIYNERIKKEKTNRDPDATLMHAA